MLPNLQAQIGSGHLTEQRRKERDGYIFGNLAQGTRAAYSIAWEQWLYFLRARNQSPFLVGMGREGRDQRSG